MSSTVEELEGLDIRISAGFDKCGVGEEISPGRVLVNTSGGLVNAAGGLDRGCDNRRGARGEQLGGTSMSNEICSAREALLIKRRFDRFSVGWENNIRR